MNYQYNQPNQQPVQPPPQQPVYIDPGEVKKRRKAGFEEFSGKVAEFCRSNGLLAAISGFSDILSYIVTGVCVVFSIVMMCLGSIYSVLSIAAVLVGVLAISKKTVLPLAVALSGVALVKLINFIFTIVFLAAASALARFSSEAAALATAYVFQIIYILLELAVLALPTVMAWQYFAATLPPKVYRPAPMYSNQTPPQGYGQVPPQQYGAQVPQQPYQQPPQQGYQQPAPQNFQQAPVQQVPPPAPPAPAQPVQPEPVQPQPAAEPQAAVQAQPSQPAVQPQPADGKFCPACGTKNNLDSAFCAKCGTKL